jgi:hypothetical protein
MKRLLLTCAAAIAAGGAVTVPAVAGLSGNPSFSHRIPVPAPSGARVVQLVDDRGGSLKIGPADSTTPVTVIASVPSGPQSSPSEATDDHGAATRHAEPGDDGGSSTEPGDDGGSSTEPGDDGGSSTEPGDDGDSSTEPSDDRGGSDSGSADSSSGHGGSDDDMSGRHGG